MPKLTRWQSKALGSRFDPLLWNSKISHLYSKPNPQSLEDNDPTISQSLEESVDNGSRLPNDEGTGRFNVGYDNRHIVYLLYLEDSDPVDEKLVEFLSAYYFGLTVVSKQISLSLQSKSKKRSFDDISQSVSFPLKVNKRLEIDVFSIFDVIVEYLPSDAFTALLIVNTPIGEGTKSVYGRACGDRVAVVSTVGIATKRELYAIIVHEMLHTFGVDHCESFACIMNPCSSDTCESTLELCPAELGKLCCVEEGLNVTERWRVLEVFCRSEGWTADADWYAKRLSFIV